ncbi:hypothetical protein UFOVP555_21 [uncultured Caudovirales phage]|uniref:Uncharacterized protein n=1 Tax=uncultured Caudovirales phage TaxID=2100421 RepID=A0A6J5MXN8_9CAUD|nr:hypothetical protein UFOVP555_21 [uncultured Caudovirales phage]
MATVDTRTGASAHFANVLGQLGDRGACRSPAKAGAGVAAVSTRIGAR